MKKRATPSKRTKRTVANTHETEFHTVSPEDNIFAVLDRPNADELLAKAELSIAIERLVKQRSLTQVDAARLLGVSQPDLSNIFRGKTAGFSIERLVRMLKLLDQDIRIEVRPKPRSRRYATIKAVVRIAAESPTVRG